SKHLSKRISKDIPTNSGHPQITVSPPNQSLTTSARKTRRQHIPLYLIFSCQRPKEPKTLAETSETAKITSSR
ncbi:hypothetical protein ACH0C8_10245, partial [Acetobacter lovaniensis]|uniref:hypothetical protein n=1 Tax=Acetobacter lovaniensis TaxID=104100 RepID=UPI00376F6181